MTALENSIADSMEESMQPYISSDEYQLPKAAINQKIVEFRNGLTEAQQKDFNLLMNMMNDAHAEFVCVRRGERHSIAGAGLDALTSPRE